MAKLLLLELLLTFVVTSGDVIFKPEGEERIPHGCTGKACIYRVHWGFSKGRFHEIAIFTVTARQTNDTYVAFGFSSEKNTNQILAVYGYMTKSGPKVVKGKILNGNTKPQLLAKSDSFDELGYSTLTYADGVFVFKLTIESRMWIIGEDHVDLRNPYYYVLMVGGGPVLNDKELGPLGNKALHYTDKKISLANVGGDVMFKREGEEGIPRGCTGKACVYRVEWEYQFDRFGDLARFTVTASQKKDTYIAFGFSTEKNANKIFAVYGYMKKSGESVIVPGKILNGNTKPQLSDTVDLRYTELTYVDGVFKLEFQMSIMSAGEDKVNLIYPYYYVLMFGGGPVLNDTELGPLGENALHYTDKKINLVMGDLCPVMTTETKIALPGPENCHAYFVCAEDGGYTVACEDELYFNTKTDTCTNKDDLTPERKKECGL